jgi:hypothetical protein
MGFNPIIVELYVLVLLFSILIGFIIRAIIEGKNMEDTSKPIIKRSITITVHGLSEDSADAIVQQFISWLDNQGEQDFWIACEQNREIAEHTDFEYSVEDNRYIPHIDIKEYVPDRD